LKLTEPRSITPIIVGFKCFERFKYKSREDCMGTKTPVSPWQMTARGDRFDWPQIRDRIDLAAVTSSLLGPAPGRRGGNGRLWWRCPFHDDKNPSLHVNPVKRTWKCYGCSEHGDAAALVMKLTQCGFPEATAFLAGKPAPLGKPICPRPLATSQPVKPPESPAKQSSGLSLADALKLVEDAARLIWTPDGQDALAYLRGRGLTERTIRQVRLGWTPDATLRTADGVRYWRASGIVIPWLENDRLALVKIRQPEGRKPKYAEAFRDRPAIYPAPSIVRPGKPLVLVEGEFDALLLGEALGDLAGAVTLGSASSKPDTAILMRLLAAAPWYVASDADNAGDRSASDWPERAIRIRPPAPCKDWTEAHIAGIDLRRWWNDRLEGIEIPLRSTWDELALRRWGPAVGDTTPGIIVDGPARGRKVAAIQATTVDWHANHPEGFLASFRKPFAIEADSDESYAVEERAAIKEYG
jgi:CHC2 zinc finger